MIGISFTSFLVLLVAGVIAAVVIHYILRYRILEGFDGFLGKCIAGWVGAWLGSPVVGHWFERVKLAGIYVIPALVGASAVAFSIVAVAKMATKACLPKSG